MAPVDQTDNAFTALLDQEDDTMTATATHAEALAARRDLPAYNLQGAPLVECRQHPGRVIYAVAELGADRDLCAECREPRNQGPTSVKDLPGRPADAAVTRQQIGGGVLMACGARDFVKDDANGLLMFRVGPGGRKVRKILVRLRPNDTYAVEYGYADMRPSRLSDPTWGQWQTVEQAHHVHAEDLAATVRRLGDRETY